MAKNDVVICDGYRNDGEARALVIDREWEAKNGTKLLTARDIARNVFRTYHVDELQNLRRSKT